MPADSLPACDEPPAPGSVADFESRRCAVCGAKYPSFGFGLPMTRACVFMWACFARRHGVERRIDSRAQPSVNEKVQGALL
jgi:hypothetical protein